MADNKIPVTKQEIRPAKKKLRDEIKWLKDIAPERRIGLAFDFQVMDREIPRTKYDLPVNKIVTEKRIISITHSRKEID